MSYSQSHIDAIRAKYNCDEDDARYFLDLREEGYSTYQAAVMAGLIDPSY